MVQLSCLVVSTFLLSTATAVRVAQITPLHPPKFAYGQALVNSYETHKMFNSLDLYFIFSSAGDRDLWLNVTSRNIPGVYPVVYRGDLDLLAKHPTFMKKWWLLEQLVDRYDFFYVIDSEVAYVKQHDAFNVSNYIWSLKLVFGVTTPCFGERIVQRSMWRFSESERSELFRHLRNGTLYLSYNEIPIVESKSAKAFITEFNVTSTPTGWGDFEDLTYIYFMMLRHGWVAVDLTPVTGQRCVSLGESGGGNRPALLRSQPHMAVRQAWRNMRSNFDDLDIVMTFNRDREVQSR